MKDSTLADVVEMEEAAATPARPPVVQQRTAIATTTPADLLVIAVEKGADIEKLERLMLLQQRWEEGEARKAFVAAMAAFKREPLEIFKKKTVEFTTRDGDTTSYKHARLSDITDAIAPAMARHGLSFDWDIHQASGVITVDCVVTHQLGHSKKVTMSGPPDASGKKNVIQQAGSTITYLQRYTLLAATGMSTKDEDDDGAGGAGGSDGNEDAPKQGDRQGNATRAPASTQSTDKPTYDQAKFDKNKADWRIVVKTGRKTPAQMIAFIETKGSLLTDSQKNTIDSWSHEND